MKKTLTIAIFTLVFVNSILFAASGNIKGYVTDSLTGEALIGANVYLDGTSFGAAADYNGLYKISNIAPGTYTLVASYIGYSNKEVEITVLENKTLEVNFELEFVVLEGNEVVVTDQAEGSISAINQQLSAQSIKNVVSSKQIQELPDANAAEAVGRLPGVSLLRSGGEGSKVVIRGLSPQYSKVQIEGVTMVSTGDGDKGGSRSSDLSMISPYMLEGIEVTKAALPDNEADVIGGTVNFLLREAPKGFHFDILTQSSYSGLKSEFGDYKFVLSGSNRFFDNKLGLFAQVDIEKRNRSSYELSVDYINETSPRETDSTEVDVTITSVNLKDITRKLNRYGGTFVLDYKLPNGLIKLNNFTSGVNRNNITRFEQHQPRQSNRQYSLTDNENDLVVMTNSLLFEYELWDIQMDAGISYAFSENKTPKQLEVKGIERSAYDDSVNVLGNPIDIPKHALNNYDDIQLEYMEILKKYSKESELGSNINFKYNFNIKKSVSVSLKTGYQYKARNKVFDKNVNRLNFTYNSINNDIILNAYPWMQDRASLGTRIMPYNLFNDPDYDGTNFLNGEYTISNMPQVDLMRDIANLLERKSSFYYTNYTKSIKDDYNGKEYYNAAYLMAEMKFGQAITFIPGVRYESNKTIYTGNRGLEGNWSDSYPHHDTTTTRLNEFWLPMIHLKYKPISWFDLRLAYTETLSRPNFSDIVPSWNRNLYYVRWNDPYLEPAHSVNYDIYASFYNNEIGLITVGYFQKKISNMIFWGSNRSIVDAEAEYGLPSIENGKTLGTMVNNPYPVNLNGIELEWKTNFWYLPGILKGLVLNINYTYTFSEAKYPRITYETIYVPEFKKIRTDTFYVNRLINQPTHIVNVTLGYDYKGFSTRASFLYTDDIFKKDNFYERHRGISTAYYKWDITVRQKLPVEGLELIGNFSNISDTIDEDINVGTGYPLKKQQYGMVIDLGIRYRY